MTSGHGESAPRNDATAWVILSLLALMVGLAHFNRVSIAVAVVTATHGISARLRAPFPVLSDLPPGEL